MHYIQAKSELREGMVKQVYSSGTYKERHKDQQFQNSLTA